METPGRIVGEGLTFREGQKSGQGYMSGRRCRWGQRQRSRGHGRVRTTQGSLTGRQSRQHQGSQGLRGVPGVRAEPA